MTKVPTCGALSVFLAQVKALVDEITYYAVQTITEFSQEEMQLFFRMAKRFTNVLKKERKKEEQTGKVRKIAIE